MRVHTTHRHVNQYGSMNHLNTCFVFLIWVLNQQTLMPLWVSLFSFIGKCAKGRTDIQKKPLIWWDGADLREVVQVWGERFERDGAGLRVQYRFEGDGTDLKGWYRFYLFMWVACDQNPIEWNAHLSSILLKVCGGRLLKVCSNHHVDTMGMHTLWRHTAHCVRPHLFTGWSWWSEIFITQLSASTTKTRGAVPITINAARKGVEKLWWCNNNVMWCE